MQFLIIDDLSSIISNLELSDPIGGGLVSENTHFDIQTSNFLDALLVSTSAALEYWGEKLMDDMNIKGERVINLKMLLLIFDDERDIDLNFNGIPLLYFKQLQNWQKDNKTKVKIKYHILKEFIYSD